MRAIKLLLISAGFIFTNIVIPNPCLAQNEKNIWYFGLNAGMDFNSGAPVFSSCSIYTDEGTAVICDSSGALLFYTEGVNAWDKFHNLMPNGIGLGGGVSATQSALIVPYPNNNNMFYIFSIEALSPGTLSVSSVDMTLNGGNGDVISNDPLMGGLSEKLCGVKHANGIDYWVLVHDFPGNTFKAYLVTANAISASPVISAVGTSLVPGSYDYRGYMKFSHDGSKLALAAFESNFVELFDFNATTGIVTAPIHLPLPVANGFQGAQGIEFSPSGRFLYVAQQSPDDVYQFDLVSNYEPAIQASMQLVGSGSSIYFGGLQLAPDGKIYVARYNTKYLAAIEYPDLQGVACSYTDVAFTLPAGSSSCRLGLPNFISGSYSYTGMPETPFAEPFHMYPNPSTGTFSIQSPPCLVSIYDAQGRLVHSQEVMDAITQMNLESLSDGLYMLSANVAGKQVCKKLMIQR